ncbi:MAG: polymerase sigma-B factor [Fimbriimonadaceae bacterium]|jgi:RNA polymerase sigma-B factor|nr:polymerase sigma-B factor [Fimbriimonadaceae bacterium]
MAAITGEYNDPELLVLRYLENPRSELKDLIIEQYASLVERTARRYSGLEPHEDLVQVGFIGLLNALTKFDRNAGVRFNTYATYLVAGEIKHYLRDRSQVIRHPAWLQELRHKVNRTVASLQHDLGRAPTEREVAENLGITESSVREVFQTQEMLRVASLDASSQGDDDGDTEAEKLDASAFCPEQLSVEDRVLLDRAMAQLRDLERTVLEYFHFEAMNQTEIAQKLNISCNYVSHILRQSLAKLRKFLVTEEERDRLLRRQAQELSYDVIDPATGVYTEAFFRARLEEEIHRASDGGQRLGIVLINFTGLNELRKFYGESSVDDFMADVAEVLKDSVRRLDIVARYGETGFAIVLPFVKHGVEIVQDRLLAKAASWMSGRYAHNSPVKVTVGCATTPDDGRSAVEVLGQMVFHPATEFETLQKAA